jgi:hypothetical protein
MCRFESDQRYQVCCCDAIGRRAAPKRAVCVGSNPSNDVLKFIAPHVPRQGDDGSKPLCVEFDSLRGCQIFKWVVP